MPRAAAVSGLKPDPIDNPAVDLNFTFPISKFPADSVPIKCFLLTF